MRGGKNCRTVFPSFIILFLLLFLCCTLAWSPVIAVDLATSCFYRASDNKDINILWRHVFMALCSPALFVCDVSWCVAVADSCLLCISVSDLSCGFLMCVPLCIGGTQTSPQNQTVMCLAGEKHDSLLVWTTSSRTLINICIEVKPLVIGVWLQRWYMTWCFLFWLWFIMKVSACRSMSSVLHRMWRRRLLYTLFYAGLSKEVSATGMFLGQGSSSCAKTLLKWCSTVSR